VIASYRLVHFTPDPFNGARERFIAAIRQVGAADDPQVAVPQA
jgi:hypothetical protein